MIYWKNRLYQFTHNNWFSVEFSVYICRNVTHGNFFTSVNQLKNHMCFTLVQIHENCMRIHYHPSNRKKKPMDKSQRIILSKIKLNSHYQKIILESFVSIKIHQNNWSTFILIILSKNGKICNDLSNKKFTPTEKWSNTNRKILTSIEQTKTRSVIIKKIYKYTDKGNIFTKFDRTEEKRNQSFFPRKQNMQNHKIIWITKKHHETLWEPIVTVCVCCRRHLGQWLNDFK